MKPRVMSLVIFTSTVGLLTAPVSITMIDAVVGIFFVTIGAGAAGALNMWYEADLDKLMTRTCLRPIPTGKINRKHALVFGTLLSIVSVVRTLFIFKFNFCSLIIFNNIFLFIYLHDLAKKINSTKYSYRRSIWRTTSSNRMDNCN